MTNIVLNLIVLAVAIVVCVPVVRRHRAGTWLTPILVAALVLCALTLVFDTLMIAVGLYEFDPDKILGIYLWGAPLEDFFYPLVAALLIPATWTALESRADRRRASSTDPEEASP
ncbi:lycopene cyclase domain-containing protein [Paraoerskovia marina]|uniref:Lycopene cyclase domain-containing protein n=1 Tax=Paraoerskovia marina TaxID=545619 RepID=A0A1H1W5K9_9CELL|nr:lycopene cyclase domain-containing protein [Paraoerskovia marina]SDS91509.1 lycopene cyclase domain-containing protein [Paraoerskovia marina]